MPPRKVRRLIAMLKRKPNFKKNTPTSRTIATNFITRKRFTTLRSRLNSIRSKVRWGRLRARFSKARGRSSMSRTGRRGGVLSLKPSGPIHSIYQYKGSYRRPARINPNFAAKVAESQGHIYRYTDLANGYIQSDIGQAAWASFEIGSAVQLSQLYQAVQNNAAGWQEPDPNTTFNAANQWKFKVKLMQMDRKITFINMASSKLHVEFYELTPRRDLHTNTNISNYTPTTLITNNKANDLVYTGGGQMTYQDPRFTAFDCPLIVANYTISKVRKFVVHGGGTFTANITCNNKHLVAGVDTAVVDNLQYDSSKTKILLMKQYGEICVAESAGGTNYIRHSVAQSVYKIEDTWKAHVSRETRLIYNDNNLSKQANVAAVAHTVIEDIDAYESIQAGNPNSTS